MILTGVRALDWAYGFALAVIVVGIVGCVVGGVRAFLTYRDNYHLRKYHQWMRAEEKRWNEHQRQQNHKEIVTQ